MLLCRCSSCWKSSTLQRQTLCDEHWMREWKWLLILQRFTSMYSMFRIFDYSCWGIHKGVILGRWSSLSFGKPLKLWWVEGKGARSTREWQTAAGKPRCGWSRFWLLENTCGRAKLPEVQSHQRPMDNNLWKSMFFARQMQLVWGLVYLIFFQKNLTQSFFTANDPWITVLPLSANKFVLCMTQMVSDDQLNFDSKLAGLLGMSCPQKSWKPREFTPWGVSSGPFNPLWLNRELLLKPAKLKTLTSTPQQLVFGSFLTYFKKTKPVVVGGCC